MDYQNLGSWNHVLTFVRAFTVKYCQICFYCKIVIIDHIQNIVLRKRQALKKRSSSVQRAPREEINRKEAWSRLRSMAACLRRVNSVNREAFSCVLVASVNLLARNRRNESRGGCSCNARASVSLSLSLSLAWLLVIGSSRGHSSGSHTRAEVFELAVERIPRARYARANQMHLEKERERKKKRVRSSERKRAKERGRKSEK